MDFEREEVRRKQTLSGKIFGPSGHIGQCNTHYNSGTITEIGLRFIHRKYNEKILVENEINCQRDPCVNNLRVVKPQGSPLSPISFYIYILNVWEETQGKIVAHADDLTIDK